MISLFNRSKRTNEKQLKKYRKTVDQINALEETFANYTDEQLKVMTTTFQSRLEQGEKIEAIIPEAFAIVREASKRVLHMRHFDVQLIGGLVLAEGNTAEMPTGEGKTLVASLPSYLRALEGKGVHVITVNDYLAERDFNQIGQVHRFLGLTVGLNLASKTAEQKKEAYLAHITYGVGTEFGFDYLRDNMSGSLDQKVQRPYHFAIIDEVDSVLIDEAKTPLIVAGKAPVSADLHMIAARLAKRFVAEVDYDFDLETKATSLTEEGISKVEAAFGVDNLYELTHQSLYHYMIQAVRAHVMFERDVDYIVQDDKILLVDMFTGRIMEGRSLSDGLHQAIEAKEGVTITEENKAQAQITIQNYFRMYPTLSGMTGTAKTQEKEFIEVYGMDVIQIPTNRPKIRVDQPDKVFLTIDQKYRAVAQEVKKRHAHGQPILIGTTSILQSEKVAKYLDAEGLTYQLLNAKSVEQEVELISQAGQLNEITVATNMAGRGTDIVLGEGVESVGGLFVLGTEKHESRRIDNQLRGRSGRQGDPGESQFFISLEDDMFVRFAKEELEKFKTKWKADEHGVIQNKYVHEFTDRTQRIVEGAHYSMREYNLKLDDVINDQRRIIYDLRDRILNGDKVFELLVSMVDESKEETLSFMQSFETDERVIATTARVMLAFIDAMWVKHLESIAHLKEGIGLRSYQQEDPMRIYQFEGLELFQMHYDELKSNIVSEMVTFMQMIAAEQEEQTDGSI